MAQIYFRSTILPNFVLNINLFAKGQTVYCDENRDLKSLNKKSYKQLFYSIDCCESKYNKLFFLQL
jgi:hypothetical protein